MKNPLPFAFFVIVAAAPGLRADDAPAAPAPPAVPARAWSDVAALSFVATGGNSQSSTLGFANTLAWKWERSSLVYNFGAIRASSSSTARYATVSPNPPGYVVVENKTTTLSAESYFFTGRYDHKLTERSFWFSSDGWERNRPAGINNRFFLNAGLGNLWLDRERTKFKTDYALGYTYEDPVFLSPGYVRGYATLRLGANFMQKIGASAAFTSDLAITDNLRHTADWLGVWKNAVTANLSKRLALKAGLDLLYDNQPAYLSLELRDALGNVVGSVPFQLKKLDTVFTTSLVVTF